MSESLPTAEKDVPPCEVHVPGRDHPSPWCAACRLSGASVFPPADPTLRCDGHYGPGSLREWDECPLCIPDDMRVTPPGVGS